ncbi:MAG: sulfurtransferase-like selenium metabolism protein YedF [Anaerolineales bacterium]|jgi:selenium metabolism protein YedF
MTDAYDVSETIILITSDGMGRGDHALKQKLIQTYLRLLDESDALPAMLCFYTEGVKLVTTGSPVIEDLRSLEDKGVRIVICGTCLNHYNLQDEVKVGIVGGMTDIIEAQFTANKVITL